MSYSVTLDLHRPFNMTDDDISIYPSTKAYTRVDGTIVRHVSNKKYVRKLPKCTDEDARAISERYAAGEKLSAIGAEYGMKYPRTWSVVKRWHDAHVGFAMPMAIADAPELEQKSESS